MPETLELSQNASKASRSQARHSALLTALFNSTLSIYQLNNTKAPNIDLKSFLEANSLPNGFDPSTLPRIDDHVNANAQPTKVYQDRCDPSKLSDGPANKQRELSNGGEPATSGQARQGGKAGLVPRPSSGQERKVWLDDRSPGASVSVQEGSAIGFPSEAQSQGLATSTNTVDFGNSDVSRPEPDLRLVDGLPLSSDNVRSMVPGDQPSTERRKAPLPSLEARKDRLEPLDRDILYGEEHVRKSPDHSQPKASTLGNSIPGQGAGSFSSPERNGPKDDTSRPDSVPKSHMHLARAEAFLGAPSTPDEQLRLEEARSLQLVPNPETTTDEISGSKEHQSMQYPHKQLSRFTHGSIEGSDEHNVPHLAQSNSQMSGGQGEATSRAPSEPKGHSASAPSGLRDHMLPGINGELSKDLTLSRRPPMRIDTGVPSMPNSIAISGNGPTTTPTAAGNTPSSSTIPSKSVHAVLSAQSPPERMTTRVSSGALRHKSVSEILGETPKTTPVHAERGTFERGLADPHREDLGSLQTPKSASSFASPDPATFKQRLSELKENERSKLSTVIFSGPRNSENAQSQRSDDKEASAEDKDYFLTLFIQKAFQPPGQPQLSNLVKTAHKTLTTSDYYTDLNERQACQILTKIHDLQSNQRWSLRQHERSTEPNRPVTHWDVLLSQMKWMRTDFREERKWKLAAAKFTADACAHWTISSLEERQSLQVTVRSKCTRTKSRSISASPPGLVGYTNDEASEATDDDDHLLAKSSPSNAPAAIFSLPPEMFIFGLKQSPVAEKLLLELPLYEPNLEVQNAVLGVSEMVPDEAWKKPLVPVSKYAEGNIISLQADEPPRKRSRFRYSDDASSRSSLREFTDLPEHMVNAVRPEQEDVALFDPDNKHIRDRIHAGHAFRPPSEYIMPTQSFFESRQSSQWTQEEDHELRKLVRDYAYNWSLISSCLSPPSLFHSGAERRTPWECFERWISLEGLPVEMAKINYFRAYHSRLQAAQRTVEAQQQALQQAQGNNAAQIPPRRRTTQPFLVDHRKTGKHIHFVDAMRKLAKKRETALQKQQHVASLAAMRKATEVVKQRAVMHTPQEFSRLKYERQVKIEEQQRQYRAQMLQQQKATQAAKANQQASQQSNGIQPLRNPIPGILNGNSPNMAAASIHGQMRGGQGDIVRPGQAPRGTNGQSHGILPNNSHGVPHAPMQPNHQAQMQMQQRLPPSMVADPRMAQEVARVQAEQVYRQQQRQHQAQVNGQAGSPPMQNPSLLSQSNPNMLASLQGRSSPSINGVLPMNASSTSPRMAQPQALSSGMTPAVNQIQAQFKARHPQASPDQIGRMTTDTLMKMSNEARQHAMQAAAGTANANAIANNSALGLQNPSPMQQAAMMTNGNNALQGMSSTQYAQYMRNPQAPQQRGASAGGGQNGSRSVTPLMSGSAQGGPRPSQSPSARPVGLAGGQ